MPARNKIQRSLVMGGSESPPMFIPTIRIKHKFRFLSGAGTFAGTITRANLLNLIVYTPTAVTSVRPIQAIRLKKVEIWTNPTALGAPPSSTALQWIGENSPSIFVEDSSMGVRPAHVLTQPPEFASERWWCLSGSLETDQLFSLVIPANTIIDVSVDVRLVELETPTAGPVPVGATVGQLYGVPLDGRGGTLLNQGYVNLP